MENLRGGVHGPGLEVEHIIPHHVLMAGTQLCGEGILLTAREVGKCSLAGCPGGKGNGLYGHTAISTA